MTGVIVLGENELVQASCRRNATKEQAVRVSRLRMLTDADRIHHIAELQKRWGLPVTAYQDAPFEFAPQMPSWDPVKAPLPCDAHLPLLNHQRPHPGSGSLESKQAGQPDHSEESS